MRPEELQQGRRGHGGRERVCEWTKLVGEASPQVYGRRNSNRLHLLKVTCPPFQLLQVAVAGRTWDDIEMALNMNFRDQVSGRITPTHHFRHFLGQKTHDKFDQQPTMATSQLGAASPQSPIHPSTHSFFSFISFHFMYFIPFVHFILFSSIPCHPISFCFIISDHLIRFRFISFIPFHFMSFI